MELKEFIKCVISQVTDAVRESQEEVKNGAIIVPKEIILSTSRTGKGLPVTIIEFDLCLANSCEKGKENGIMVALSQIGLRHEKSEKNIETHENRIRFSIPVLFSEHLRK